MEEQGHAKYLIIGARSKENKKLKRQNLCLGTIYAPVDEGWPSEVNVQRAGGDNQNLGRDQKRWRKPWPVNGGDLRICYDPH